MATATVTSKGQITIPVSVRTALGLATGSRVEFVRIDDRHFAIIAANEDVQSLKGMLRKPAAPVSIEQMNESIAARGAAAR